MTASFLRIPLRRLTGAAAVAGFLCLCGCALVTQHRGYYIADDRAKNVFVMDSFVYSALPLSDTDAELRIRVDQEPLRVLAAGVLVPVVPTFLGDHWDSTAVDGIDSVTVRVRIETAAEVRVDWDAARLVTADGDELGAARSAPERIFGMSDDAVVYRAALPRSSAEPPDLFLILPAIQLDGETLLAVRVPLHRRTITRFWFGM